MTTYEVIKLSNPRQARKKYIRYVMRLLPYQWVTSFEAYEALEFYDLNDFIKMTVGRRTEEQTQAIMELSIKASDPEDYERHGSTPIAVLEEFQRINTQYARFPMLKSHLAKFDGKLYELTRSSKCHDSKRILILFCTKPARIIQYAWMNYQKRKRDQASRVIQEYVRNWLYRPGGPMMKRAEASFYNTASRQ